MTRWLRPMRSFRAHVALMAVVPAVIGIAVLVVFSMLAVAERRHAVIDKIQRSHLAGPALRDTHAHDWVSLEQQLDASFSGFSDTVPERPRVVLLVQDGHGRDLYRSRYWPAGLDARLPTPFPAGCAGAAPARCAALPPGSPPLTDVVLGRDEWRIGAIGTVDAAGTPRHLWLAVNWTLPRATMHATARHFYLATLPMFLLVGVTAWLLAGRAMRPVEHLTAAMVAVNANARFEHVRPADEALEFAQLINVFNDMGDRVQRSFTHAIRFSGNAAHELKTPLTILQGELERCFERAAHDPVLEQSLTRMIDEVRGLDSIVRKLLLLSRADAGQLQLPMTAVDLRPLLDELAEDIVMLAPAGDAAPSLPPEVLVRGDIELLGQVLRNLVSNALKYRVADGWISLSAVRESEAWHIDVANASDGIPADQREQLFERFYRADEAHNRRIAGVGLGLALAREIAHAHKGTLVLLAPVAGRETFRLTLPVA
ncbi:HAMP domain-containing sensor histidine kinase [Massilia sp. YMA4]|uniref:sensor histidine kinase n=1 Tax=Massilia sp. YMA4 TaxID=1593482 RepID=UPI000DD12F63|nr:HAMP domain-containing sensor histidine kinase [Massilia sp. YMA4]AXA93466.1 two-component sensor histidine kinase [Massilia sp. YMA4]